MRRTLAKVSGRLAAPLFVALVAASAVAVQAPGANETVELPETQEVLGVQGQVHYLPFSGPNFLAVLRGEHGSSTNVDNPVRLITSIVSALDDNEVTIDHWEDGYDADPLAAPGSSTETLTMSEGETHLLDNWVNTNNVGQMNPGGAPTPYYDGGDRLVSSGAIVVTAGGWPTTATTLHANAAVVPDVNRYGYQFTAPVGEDVVSAPAAGSSTSMWEYAGFLVIASQDDTTVSVNGGSSFPLDAGQSHLVNGGVDLGDSLTADKPVLVYMATGDKTPGAGAYEGRIFRLTPTENWSNSYVTPVTSRGTSASGSAAETTRVYLYNPGSSALTVDYTLSNATTGSISVPADGQANYLVPQNVGARFTSANGDPFYAIHAITTPESGADSSASYNWGFALTPTESLTPMVVIGYGPGSDGNTENDSAVWVSALANTRLYVDLDADAGTGGLTDPNGNQYDFHCDVTALQVRLVADDGTGQCRNASVFGTGTPAVGRTKGTGDADMTGARLYTTTGVSIAAAWGQVSNLTAVAPAIDMGTTVLPFPTIDLSKDAEILEDDGDGEAVPGDTIRYTITMTNRGISPVDNLLVNDEVPANTSYVEDSTVANGTAITDPSTGTAFPLDEGGLLVPPVLEVGQTRTVTYDLLVDDPLPPGTTEIVNEITLESTYGTYTDSHTVPVADPGSIGDRVWNDVDGDGTQDGGEVGLTGVTVELLNDDDELVASTTTGVDGAYTFSDVYPGTYTVRIDTDSLPAGMTGTHDLDGTGTADEASVGIAVGQDRTDVDFGYVAASISLAKTVYAGHDGGAGCVTNTNDLVSGETTDDVTWCFVVTNTGPAGLVGVTVDDPDLGIDQGAMALEAGNPAVLGTGQSVVWSYEGDIDGALVNDATATALLSLGGPSRTATDSAEVRVVGPGISLEKTAYRGHDGGASCDGAQEVTVEQGGPLTYCFRVTNSGQTALSAVSFSDPDLDIDEGDQVHALLTPGQSHTFHVEVTATADLVNTATATGTSPAGVQPEATDSVEVDVVHPALELQKSIYAGHDDGAGCTGGEELVRRTGDPVTWCFEVTNEGDVDLSDLTLDDLLLGVDEGDLEVLSGSTSGLAPGGSVRLYLETTADDDVENTATAGGQPPVGPAVSDDDTASLDVILPAISVEKSVYPGHDGGAGCEGSDQLDARSGDEVTYCFAVSNDGDVDLTDVTVDDLDLDDSGLALASGSVTPLAAGQGAVFYLEAVVDGDLDNTVEVSGQPPVGPPVTGGDTATVDEVHPDLTIEKTVYGGHDGGAQCDTAGDLHHDEDDTPDTWCFAVTNTGDVALTDVRIEDDLLGVDQDGLTPLSGSLDDLDPGDSVVLYLEDTLTDDLENTAIATATPAVGGDVTDADTAAVEVQVPSIDLQKTVYAGHDGGASCDDGEESIIARTGGLVTWCLLVTNDGDTDVHATVTDAAIDLSQSVDLGPGESTTIHVEGSVEEDLPNTATVSGSSPGDHQVEDSDGASVDVVHPSITLDKAVHRGHDGGASCAGADDFVDDEADQPITWCFHVTNDGDVTVTDITLDDVDLGVDESGLEFPAGALDELAPGESVDLHLEGFLTEDLENDAVATAVAPVGPDVTDDGRAEVDLLVPAVTVAKTVYAGDDDGARCDDGSESIVAQAGARVTWCFLVHNTGDTPLRVTVEDDQLEGYPGHVLDLDPNESQTVWFATTVEGNLDNTVTVDGETPDHDHVTATDDASVFEIHPAVTVVKTVYAGHDEGAGCEATTEADDSDLEAEVNEDVTWCFRIENTGDVDLSDLRLDDDEIDVTEADVTPLGGGDLETLDDGEVLWAYVEDVVDVALVNDVTVTGTAPDGEDVDDTDTAEVVVVGPGIGIAKKVVLTPQGNGDGSYTLQYRLRVTNSGQTTLDDLQVTEDLAATFHGAAGFELGEVTAPGLHLNPDYDGRTDVELLTGEDQLDVLQTEDIHVTVTVRPGANLGPYLNTALATGTSPIGVVVSDESDSGSDADPREPNPGEPGDTDGTDDPVPVTFPAVDLVISKGVERTQVDGDLGTAHWVIQVGNAGPGDDPGPITVTDQLDERLAFVSASGDGWECDERDQLVTCVWDQPLAAGEQADDIHVLTETEIVRDEDIANAAHVASTVGEDRVDNNDSAAEVTAWVDEASVPSTLPRTGATIGGLVLLGLGLVLGGRLLQRRGRAVPA